MTRNYPHPYLHYNASELVLCNFMSDAAMIEAKRIIDKEGGWIENADGHIVYGRKPGTINLTPTWRGVLLLLLETYTNGTDKGRAMALAELKNMAKLADEYNASLPK